MMVLKNAVYVKVFGDNMNQRLLRLNNAELRRGEALRMQVIFARMSLDEFMKYITLELKLNAKNEAHVQDRHGQGHRGHQEDRHHREVKGDTAAPQKMGLEAVKIDALWRNNKKSTSSSLSRIT